MDTKKITVIPVDDKTFSEQSDVEIKKYLAKTNEDFNDYFAPLYQNFQKKFQNKEWVYLNRVGHDEGVYYVNDISGLIPDLDVHSCNYAYSYRPINYKDSNILHPSRLVFAGFQGYIPSRNEAQKLFNDNLKYFRDNNGDIKVCGSSQKGLTVDNGNYYMWTANNYKYQIYGYSGSQQHYFWIIPIYKFSLSSNAKPQKIIWTWLEYDLAPKIFPSADSKSIFATLKKYKEFFIFRNDKITFDEKKVYEAIKAGKKFEFLTIPTKTTFDDKSFEDTIRSELLSCDNRRVGLDQYDEKLLLDPNRGHWDLWDLSEAVDKGVKLKTAIYARNPESDINASGIVAIDFGTKSTVVVYENERGEIIPLQVGAGDYSKGVKAKNYENPTIIEFKHIENFLSAYKARAGRPKTSLDDVTVSHMAQENLKSTLNSMLYTSFFENLKQWCGDLQYTTKIVDHDGTEKDLVAFLDITKDEFNPLEYYAYYLGSYINNMFNNIFMKYILSFPVMYERNIRERMLKAFRAGILKSLPTALLNNENAMKNFQVLEGVSEPSAYAITALEGYGFLNGEENDGVYYSVFDFGGGTTDFDFGVLRLAEDEDADFYDYVLTHFGAHGDRTLGGENLLRLMAFEIFKANQDKLLKPDENSEAKIPFTWAAERREFAGAQALIRSSQEANLNMHNLMEELRPIWETPDSEKAKEIFNSGKISVTLFNDAGGDKPEFNLSVGVQNFFEEVKSLPNVQAKPTPKTNSLEISEKKFNRVKRKAWEGDFDAIKNLGEWASIGSVDSVEELIKLHENGFNKASDILNANFPEFEAKRIAAEEREILRQTPPLVDLKKILTDRITRGIDNFFISLRDAFDKVSGGEDNGVAALSDVEEIAIFLAGNSTKSALVNKLFEEYIDAEKGKARELLGFGKEQKMPRFVLYPPLGTDAADKIQESRGVVVDKKNFERPTGKTGVAFGLLRCRAGSAVRVVDITPEGVDKKQVPFQFYVGRARLGKFKILIDKSTKLGKWCKFIGAKLGVFDLLYTDESIAATNNAPASIAKRLTIHVDADPEASVYVQAVESNKIRYVVSKGEPTDEIEGKLITLE